MKKQAIAFLAFAVLLLAGCGTPNVQPFDANLAYANFIAQPRTYSALTLKTKPDAQITLSGEFELIMEAPLNPLSMRSNDPSTAQTTISALERVIKAIGLGYFANEAISSLSASRDPVIVEQPAPLVITTPAGP
jgi:hypothetical protein